MEEMKLTYHEVDGILYPDIKVPEDQEQNLRTLGKYGRMAMNYLKDNHKERYKSLYRFGKLAQKMQQVDEEANQMMDMLMEKYLLKHKPMNASLTMEMWKIREQAEEIVLHQIVLTHH